MRWLRREVGMWREGARLLLSREFWQAFHEYWSAESVQARTDLWISKHRATWGQEPDWSVERRIAERRKKEIRSL